MPPFFNFKTGTLTDALFSHNNSMRGDSGVCGDILGLSLPPLLGRLTVLHGIKAEHQSPNSNELGESQSSSSQDGGNAPALSCCTRTPRTAW